MKERKLTKEAQNLEDRGFKIGEGGTLYAILAKNRLGERNIDAVLSCDGNTGKVKPNTELKPKAEWEQPQQEQPQQGNLDLDDGNYID